MPPMDAGCARSGQLARPYWSERVQCGARCRLHPTRERGRFRKHLRRSAYYCVRGAPFQHQLRKTAGGRGVRTAASTARLDHGRRLRAGPRKRVTWQRRLPAISLQVLAGANPRRRSALPWVSARREHHGICRRSTPRPATCGEAGTPLHRHHRLCGPFVLVRRRCRWRPISSRRPRT